VVSSVIADGILHFDRHRPDADLDAGAREHVHRRAVETRRRSRPRSGSASRDPSETSEHQLVFDEIERQREGPPL
jgi:hypothetical protein